MNLFRSLSVYNEHQQLPEKAKLCFIKQGNSIRCGIEAVGSAGEGCRTSVGEAKLALRECLVCFMPQHHSSLYLTNVCLKSTAGCHDEMRLIATRLLFRFVVVE